MTPKYPVYVPSRGRFERCPTAGFLARDGVDFRLVVEPHEQAEYATRFGAERLLVLPRSDMTLIGARNWIKDHATATGAERHWQLDDNISYVGRRWKGRRIRCDAGAALRAVEDFVDRYDNVAVAGLNYYMNLKDGHPWPPFYVNQHVYSCSLVLNALPQRWRTLYNDDVDMCLQVLAAGWCTVLVNAFCVQKLPTMVVKGGNTPIYQGDGRLRMARSLERLWPGVVETRRRFKRPQHVVKDTWRRFTTPLRLKPGVDLGAIEPNEYGLELVELAPIRSRRLRELVDPR